MMSHCNSAYACDFPCSIFSKLVIISILQRSILALCLLAVWLEANMSAYPWCLLRVKYLRARPGELARALSATVRFEYSKSTF
jgi:hypothetical protein